MKTVRFSVFTLLFFWSFNGHAQQEPPTEYGSGLKVDLSEKGDMYFRLITFHQFWLDGKTHPVNGENKFTVTPMLRRSRFLMFAQLTDHFLIVTHFGINNLTPAGLHPTGQSSQTQLFMHDAWAEFKVTKYLYLGGGLHYWNGISRLNNQSTLNFLPLDNPRFAWSTIGTTDQFARHLGVYAKGKIGKLDYRLAWNGPMVNSVDVINGVAPALNKASYVGRATYGAEASNVFAGYFNYQFFDQESNKLPYFVGTYLGKKKILNVGAGFNIHPKGSISLNELGDSISNNVLLWAVDVYSELPIGNNGGAVTGYLVYQTNNYGKNYQLNGTSQDVFTGSVIYFQGGCLLGSESNVAWQPYVTYSNKSITALNGSTSDIGVGLNCLLTGHHAKLTLEYRNSGRVNADAVNRLIFQAVIFL